MPETSGGLAVAFGLGSGAGTFGAVTDNGNGTYSAVFTGSTAGSNTVTATLNGQPVTTSPATVIVTPAAVSMAASTLSVSAAALPVGGTTSVTLTARDAYGNLEVGGGLTVAFSLASGTGNLSQVIDNGTGTYIATFTATSPGNDTVVATINNQAVTSSPAGITVVALSLPESSVSATPMTIPSGGTATLTLTARDFSGDQETTGGLQVAFGLGTGIGGGTLGSVTDNGDGTYSATFTGGTPGTIGITATIDGQPVTSTVPITVMAVSLSKSSVAVNLTTIPVGGNATVTLIARDFSGNQEITGGLPVAFGLGTGAGGGSVGAVTDNADGIYSATFTATTSGSYTVTATIEGQPVTSTVAITVVVPGAPLVTTNPSSQVASAGDSVSFVAAAAGSPTPTVQWQVSTDGGNTFTNVAGATSTTLTFTPTAAQNDNEYCAVFTNPSGSATTAAATLTVSTTPSDLVISATTGVFPQFQLPSGLGHPLLTLSNGNMVVGGSDFDSVFLVNGQTEAIISALTGTGADLTATALTNGNFVVSGAAGAATWGSGTAGVSGTVSAANSLVEGGSPSGGTVIPLANGNYVVDFSGWNGATGAVTWGNGTTGTTGTVSAANSLVGSSLGDTVGGGNDQGVTALPNGNYVVDSPYWNNNEGAVTWGDGTKGVAGTISAANSLVGSTGGTAEGGDEVGNYGVTVLTYGNYVVASPYWDGYEGAVTWGSGTSGVKGLVSAANSLVGSTAGDSVGQGIVMALNNGNYVVDSYTWNSNSGAVTWGNGTTGVSGVVSAANSLVGGEFVGYAPGMPRGVGVTALANGNYVVASGYWNGEVGAVTWGNGTTGTIGLVTADNSLVGSKVGDLTSTCVTALPNGNYVVASPNWNNYEGAVTWGNGTTGTIGTVSAGNSLVGSMPANSQTGFSDQVGGGGQVDESDQGGVTALTNGNYVVDSPFWHGDTGAVTWGNGTTGTIGTVSAANSLVGSYAHDTVGAGGLASNGVTEAYGGFTALSNGNYVVDSPFWNNLEGAVTWGDGTTGVSGVVSAANSLIGTVAGDLVGGGGVTALPNGNYVLLTASSATWGNGTAGTVGTFSTANSFTNPTVDHTGNGVFTVTALPNGNYVVINAPGTNVTGGATVPEATWVDGTSGTTLDGQNTPDAQNSFYGGGGGAGITPISLGSAFFYTFATLNDETVTVGITDPNLLTYALGQGQTITVTPDFITRTLDAGINVTLQSNDDIIINSPIIENPTGKAGSLTLQSGRSIILNASIDTAGGNLSLIANDTVADGVVSSLRDPGAAAITMASGVTLNTGAGKLTTDLKNSTVVTIAPASLAAGTIGVSYTQQLTASGGTAPYTFTVSGGAMPPGLALSSAGLISGMPTAGGSFSFTVQATDAANNTGTQNYTIAAAPIGISPTSLPAATVGAAYAQTVTGSGGTAPYTFTITAGALPTGLSLSSGGTLSGTPTAGGSFTFTIQAKDSSTGSGPYTASQQYTLILPPEFVYNPITETLVITLIPSLPSFQYTQVTTASGGTTSSVYTFTLSGSSAPTVSESFTDAQLTTSPASGGASVTVIGQGLAGTAVLITNDTYVDQSGNKQETPERISLGSLTDAGVGTMSKFVGNNPNTTPYSFLSLSNFPVSYAYAGRADGTIMLQGTEGTGEVGFVTAGYYSYIAAAVTGDYAHFGEGTPDVIGTSAGNAADFAYHYTSSAPSAVSSITSVFTVNGIASSSMAGSQTNPEDGGAIDTFNNLANGFVLNTAVSYTGNSIAYINDSPLSDTYVGLSTDPLGLGSIGGIAGFSYMYVGAFPAFSEFDVAYGFGTYYASSTMGGHDIDYPGAPANNVFSGSWIQSFS